MTKYLQWLWYNFEREIGNLVMSPRKSWQKYEQDVSAGHRGCHVGGPGKPDYTRGEVEGEAKLRGKPLTKTEVMRECRKGRREIVCNAGFTEPAKEYTKRYRPNVRLLQHKTNKK